MFSELIGAQRPQRQQARPEEDEDENIDTGLIGNDEDIEDVDNRGFFEEPNFGFNTAREKFNFPGDSREDIPMLPEIENMDDREPSIYRKPYKSYPDYPRGYPRRYPSKRYSIKPSYHEDSMDHYNPMDYDHNPTDVDVFNPEPRSFENEHDPFFIDIPKINVNNHLDYQGPKSARLERFHKPDISSHLNVPDHEIPPYRNPHRKGLYPDHHEPDHYDHHDHHQPKHFDHPKPDFSYSGHTGEPKEFHHPEPDFTYSGHSDTPKKFHHPKGDFSYSGHSDRPKEFHHPKADFSRPEHFDHQPQFKPPRLDFASKRRHTELPSEPTFPTFDQIERTSEPSEPQFVSDMPHLPPPPEMVELQKNSLFPVDVPKIGSKIDYRPPELIFDEYHRRIDFPDESAPTKMERKMDEDFRLEIPKPPKPFRLSKFSDMILTQSAKSASNFEPPTYSRKDDKETWNELPSFSEKPVKTEFETFEAIPQTFDEKSMQFYEDYESKPLRFDRYDNKPVRFNSYKAQEKPVRFQKYTEEPRYKKPVRFESQERSISYSEKPTTVRFEEHEAKPATQRYNEDYDYMEDYESEPAVQKPKRPPTTPKYPVFKEEPVTSRYFDYEDDEPVAKKPIMIKREKVPDLPRRPTPESFHETIQDQFEFHAKPNHYENEALTETEPPVYVPKTTYKYENDYQEELPVRPEVTPEPSYSNRRFDR